MEPLANVDPDEKGKAPTLKRKMEFIFPMEGKLMSDALKITRTLRSLAGMRDPAPGENSSVGGGRQGVQERGNGKEGEEAHTPCWNAGKSSRLIAVDEKEEWAENILSSGARTKFEMYKADELSSRIDHTIYEVCIIYSLVFMLCIITIVM